MSYNEYNVKVITKSNDRLLDGYAIQISSLKTFDYYILVKNSYYEKYFVVNFVFENTSLLEKSFGYFKKNSFGNHVIIEDQTIKINYISYIKLFYRLLDCLKWNEKKIYMKVSG